MLAVTLLLYGIYFIIAGVEGNAPTVATMVGQEGQFLYWMVVIMVLLLLWETDTGSELARPFAMLIVLGWLLHKNNGVANYVTLGTNAKAILPNI